ncbi:PPE domain-containing protein [Mycobacterium sp. E3247]|uniref:PPE domain-containing protein n=1 Tax=Mycobacterium sp. E3247 TaxID=1856864 RepID=UPI0007FC71D3|nr:PPE domain-containing protein [Mycobacterium sp. E3247]OBG99292.1 hypothetical protein A9X04_03160 [Mycobacterium sp. E3247]
MGFTDVVWQSRSTEQLARDLTDGPGPAPVGEAGASWERVARELAGVSTDFDKLVDRLRDAWTSQASTAAVGRLEEFGRWLQALALSAATNGQRAEKAAMATTEAWLAMPSVPEALQAKATHDMMASLAAYSGAVLTGRFAELDEAATTSHADAAAVMAHYEDAVSDLAQPWDQASPPQVSRNGPAPAEHAQDRSSGAGGRGSPTTVSAPPLAPMLATGIAPTAQPKPLHQNGFAATGAAGTGGTAAGAGYGPMAALGRADQNREYESSQAGEPLDGAGEPGAGLGYSEQPWWQAGASNESQLASSVSWVPDTSVFDQLAVPEGPPPDTVADEPVTARMFDGGASTPVIGVDRELRL